MTTTTMLPADPRNEAAYATFQWLASRVASENGQDMFPAPSFDAYQAAARTVNDTAAKALVETKAPIGMRVYTADGDLVVAVSAESGNRLGVQLTSDGRYVDASTWHDGPEDAFVRYERWMLTDTGTIEDRSHGYCDGTTRRLTQVG